MARRNPEPPKWWNIKLYSFCEKLSLEGWVWEFMRRARLLQIMGYAPVDAMNPKPKTDHLDADYLTYYRSWANCERTKIKPFLSPQAVVLKPSEGWPKGFHGQQYRVLDESMDEIARARLQRPFVDFRVDLNRRDTRIKKEFKELLESLRLKHPQPHKRRNPRLSYWHDIHVLPVWDLNQLGLTAPSIAKKFPRFHKKDIEGNIIELFEQSVTNSLNAGRRYIDNGRWLELAYLIKPK